MTPYNHTPTPEIEKFMNQETWIDGTLQEVDEQVVYTPTEQSRVAQRKKQKRMREELHPLKMFSKDSFFNKRSLRSAWSHQQNRFHQ